MVAVTDKLEEILMKNKQGINGDSNLQAGRDINVFGGSTHWEPIRFYEEDLKEIILYFSKTLQGKESSSDDFSKTDIETKNELNNLSSQYFKFILDRSLSYFSKIDQFLGDARNASFLQMYEATIIELQHKILSHEHRCQNQEFCIETYFELAYEYFFKDGYKDLVANRNLVLVFFHYMYWNCDIGKKL